MYPKIHSFLIIIGLNRTKNKLKKGKSREKQKLIVQKRKLVLEPEVSFAINFLTTYFKLFVRICRYLTYIE